MTSGGLITTDLRMPKTVGIEALASKPKFKDWRAKSDPVMVPDRGFVKQLKKLDKEYEVMWDWGSAVWEVWKFPRAFGREPYHVTTVAAKGKSYRELGADVLLKLEKSRRLNERFTGSQLADYFDEMDDQIARKKEEEFRTRLKDIALDSFINIHCKIIQVPKEFKVRRVIEDGRL